MYLTKEVDFKLNSKRTFRGLPFFLRKVVAVKRALWVHNALLAIITRAKPLKGRRRARQERCWYNSCKGLAFNWPDKYWFGPRVTSRMIDITSDRAGTIFVNHFSVVQSGNWSLALMRSIRAIEKRSGLMLSQFFATSSSRFRSWRLLSLALPCIPSGRSFYIHAAM